MIESLSSTYILPYKLSGQNTKKPKQSVHPLSKGWSWLLSFFSLHSFDNTLFFLHKPVYAIDLEIALNPKSVRSVAIRHSLRFSSKAK